MLPSTGAWGTWTQPGVAPASARLWATVKAVMVPTSCRHPHTRSRSPKTKMRRVNAVEDAERLWRCGASVLPGPRRGCCVALRAVSQTASHLGASGLVRPRASRLRGGRSGPRSGRGLRLPRAPRHHGRGAAEPATRPAGSPRPALGCSTHRARVALLLDHGGRGWTWAPVLHRPGRVACNRR